MTGPTFHRSLAERYDVRHAWIQRDDKRGNVHAEAVPLQ